MCLAVPGKIISIDRSIPEMTMAKVDFGGILKNICIISSLTQGSLYLL